MNDRLLAGSLAGLTGAIIQDIFCRLAKVAGFTDRSYGDLVGVLLTDPNQSSLKGMIVGFLGHVALGILFGVVFVFILNYSDSQYLILKGIFFSMVLWTLMLGLGAVLNLSLVKDMPANAALVIFAGSMLYGIIMAAMLKVLERNSNFI